MDLKDLTNWCRNTFLTDGKSLRKPFRITGQEQHQDSTQAQVVFLVTIQGKEVNLGINPSWTVSNESVWQVPLPSRNKKTRVHMLKSLALFTGGLQKGKFRYLLRRSTHMRKNMSALDVMAVLESLPERDNPEALSSLNIIRNTDKDRLL